MAPHQAQRDLSPLVQGAGGGPGDTCPLVPPGEGASPPPSPPLSPDPGRPLHHRWLLTHMAGIGENICPARDYSSRSLCLSSTSSLSCVSGEEELYCGDTHYCARVNEVPTLLLRLTKSYKNYFRLKCHEGP